MVSLKKAATALGLEKDDVRSMLDAGAIKGERKAVGEKQKWFIHHREIESFLGSKRIQGWNAKQDRASVTGMNQFFEPDESSKTENALTEIDEVNEVEEQVKINYLQPDTSTRIDAILRTLTTEFAHRLCEERQNVVTLQQEVSAKEEKIGQLTEAEAHLRERLTCLDSSKDAEIRCLNTQINLLEERLAERRKPWWARLFPG
jgi:hypothetical protein